MKMNNLLPALAMFAVASCVQAHADTLADWTFETSAPTTAGPLSPEIGTGSALGSHASGAAVYSTPAGNGSSHSFSSNTWGIGDYYQFSTSTLGFSDITLSFAQNGSATGPSAFKLAYSVNGGTFIDVPSGSYNVPSNGTTALVWSAGSAVAASDLSFDLSGISALDDASTVAFRIIDTSTTAINGGTVGTAGTDRVDNFTISATEDTVSTPEPSTWALFSVALGVMGFFYFRRQATI